MPELDHQRLRLSLEAAGKPRLFGLLLPAVGRTIDDRFEITGLAAAGRQSFVFLAIDRATGAQVVIKQPAFDYRRPIAYSRQDVARARAELEREHTVLVSSGAPQFPQPIALANARAIVPCAERSAVFGAQELFLVEEHIRGATLAERGLSRESEAARVALEVVSFVRALLQQGRFYADVSAANLMLEPGGSLRIVDAGSVAPIRSGRVPARGLTPAFTTPRLSAALQHGGELPADLSSTLPILAKVLHYALTGREPFNGALPDLAALAMICSELGIAALRAMLGLDTDPTRIAEAEEVLLSWARKAALAGAHPPD